MTIDDLDTAIREEVGRGNPGCRINNAGLK